MISYICVFASGAIASGLTVLIVPKTEFELRHGVTIAWSRVIPVYGVAVALLVVAAFVH